MYQRAAGSLTIELEGISSVRSSEYIEKAMVLYVVVSRVLAIVFREKILVVIPVLMKSRFLKTDSKP